MKCETNRSPLCFLLGGLLVLAACGGGSEVGLSPVEESQSHGPSAVVSFPTALDVAQGFNFSKTEQASVGFVTKLKLGDVELKADQASIKDPEQPGQNLGTEVVGTLSHYLWETGTTDAMYLSLQISEDNKNKLSAKLLTDWTNMEVVFSYVIYEYDPKAKKYFKANWCESELKGILEKNGHELNLTVGNGPSTAVQSPKNFTLQVGIKPQTEEQMVHMATAYSKNLTKLWGVDNEGD